MKDKLIRFVDDMVVLTSNNKALQRIIKKLEGRMK